MNKHISIDIESLATTADAVILSIGAVVFDATGLYDTFYTVLDTRSQGTRRVDPATEAWWSKQSEEARAVLTAKDREHVLFALGRLHEFVNANDHEGIWAMGSQFDIAALELMYSTLNLPIPWHYRSPRDLRTVRAQFFKAFSAATLPSHDGVAHHALDDAVRQAREAQHMNKQLGGHIL